MMAFEYVETPELLLGTSDFVLQVPGGIRSKSDLLTALAGVGQFPGYFGCNWDALLDCLRDLSWITSKEVVILHSDLPLQDSPEECRIYLELLQIAIADWSQPPKSHVVAPPSEWPYVEHKLRVVFPSEAHRAVTRVLQEAV